jgi:cyclophilin family peptidyl-prolyl cis-trans isomerase
MAFKDHFDKETRKLLLILAGIAILVLVVIPTTSPFLGQKNNAANPIATFLTNLNPDAYVTPPVATLTPNKDYKAEIVTSKGTFVIDLDEKNASQNVSNFIGMSKHYKNTSIAIDKDYLFKIDTPVEVKYNISDEINAESLGLNDIKVKDATYLRATYDAKNPDTKAFEPNNLRKYEDYTVRQFYEDVLGYKYNSSITSPKAVKYTVYMASKGPNQNKLDFFVLMAPSSPEIDGRYTPIGHVVSGFTILDDINSSTNETIRVAGVVIP